MDFGPAVPIVVAFIAGMATLYAAQIAARQKQRETLATERSAAYQSLVQTARAFQAQAKARADSLTPSAGPNEPPAMPDLEALEGAVDVVHQLAPRAVRSPVARLSFFASVVTFQLKWSEPTAEGRGQVREAMGNFTKALDNAVEQINEDQRPR